MPQTELKHRDYSLSFNDCTLLAEESIDYGGPRGFLVRVFEGKSTTSGRKLYIIQKIGTSTVAGESDLATVRTARTPSGLIKALHSPSKPQVDGSRALYLPRASRAVLARLREQLPEVEKAWQRFTTTD